MLLKYVISRVFHSIKWIVFLYFLYDRFHDDEAGSAAVFFGIIAILFYYLFKDYFRLDYKVWKSEKRIRELGKWRRL